MLQVDVQLGLICVGEVEASFVWALVAFNDKHLPDDEALQQDNTAISAMRVKRSVDCLLSGATETGVTHRAKLRSAGPASAVNWMLRGRAGEAHLVVLAHTEERRVECALASAGRCTPCERGHTISDAAVPVTGECCTDHHI